MSPTGSSEARRWREGVDKVVGMAHRLGITSQLERYPTVPLGFNDVSLWELIQAYLPFFNGGCRQQLYLIQTIRNQKGEVVYQEPHNGCERVLAPEVVRAMRTSLEAVVDHPYGTAHELRKVFPKGALAGKTGTATKSDGTIRPSRLRFLTAESSISHDTQPLRWIEAEWP